VDWSVSRFGHGGGDRRDAPYPREKGDEMVLVLAPVAHGDESAGWTAFVPREPRRRGRPHRRSLWRISVIRRGQATPIRGLAHPENKHQVYVVNQRPMGATRVLHFSFGARACRSGQVTRGLTVCDRNFHFDRVFLTVVNQGNSPVESFNAIHRYTRLADLRIIGSARLRYDDVVDRFPMPVVHLERLPIRREARREMQFVHFQP